jgi:hypothetical protein
VEEEGLRVGRGGNRLSDFFMFGERGVSGVMRMRRGAKAKDQREKSQA